MSGLDATPESPYLSSLQILISSAADVLSNESVVKMIFLFSDVFSEEQLQLLLSTNAPKCLRIFALIKVVLSLKKLHTNLATNIWAELLFLTKNYRFLKSLKTCKHEMKDQILRGSPFFSSLFRRFLVSLADEMTNEDLQYIWRRLHPGNTDYPEQPELLFCSMLADRYIREDNVKELLIHFDVLGRLDLLRKTEQYIEKAGIIVQKSEEYDLEFDGATGHCGVALVFNIEDFDKEPAPEYQDLSEDKELFDKRLGTNVDAVCLKRLWESFGIQTFIHKNTDVIQFQTYLNECLSGDLSLVKIFILCILTHGNPGLVFCADRVPIDISDIEEILGTCEKLAGIPKLMFVQACQGVQIQRKGASSAITESYQFDNNISGASQKMPVPQFSDMVIGMSTVPGFMSIRSKTEGTIFIQALVDVLETEGDKQDFASLITKINHKMAHKWTPYVHKKETLQLVQMPSFRHHLTKTLRFKRALLRVASLELDINSKTTSNIL